MEMIEAYKRGMRLYAIFDGRARRKDFWLFTLFLLLASSAIALIEGVILGGLFGGGLVGLFNLVHFVPSLAIGGRRLHDTGKSAWWLLMILVPLIGFIVLIVFYCTAGDKGANVYGQDPKAGIA